MPYYPWLPSHVLPCPLSHFLSTLRNLTVITFGLPPSLIPADLILTVDNGWGSCSSLAFPIPCSAHLSRWNAQGSITTSKPKAVPRVEEGRWGRSLGLGLLIITLFQMGKFHRGVVLPCCLLPENDDKMDRAIKFIGLHVTSLEGGLDTDHSVVVFFIFKLSCKQRHCRIVCGNFYKNIVCTYVQMPVQWTSVYSYMCVVREREACVRPAVLLLNP